MYPSDPILEESAMPSDTSRIDPVTLALLSGILLAAAALFWPLLDVVILALSVAVVIYPVHRFLSRFMPGAAAAGATVAAVVIVLLASGAFVTLVLARNAEYLIGILGIIADWIAAPTLGEAGALLPIPQDDIAALFAGQAANLKASLSGTAALAPLMGVKIIVFFLTLYVALHKGAEAVKGLASHLPAAFGDAVGRMSKVTVDTLYAIYVVHVATSVITFFLALPFFYVLGYGHVLFYSVMAGVFQLVPIIGPSLIMLFLGIFALSIGDMRGAVLVALVGYPVVCALPDIYFRPLMMGRRASIHPVIMWIGFFGGLAVMGIIGFVLGPLFLALLVAGYATLIRGRRSGSAALILPESPELRSKV
ncbi:AI-2E family transporter [Methanoculleus taiwanensis]|nr:AI-2E family transporter [Methanoculleus taiwanensis]